MKIGQVEFTWRAHRQACAVKIGGEAILAKDWNQYAADNGLDEKLEDIPAHGDCVSRVEVDGEEYILLYVL